MNIHANTLNASILSGTPLDRWKTVHSNMLSKIDGLPQVDKLRVIHLYEADYNGYLKKEWLNQAVWHATERKIPNDSQGGGGQKGRQANHIALQKDMKYHYARLRKQNLATIDNDAKACYDRIIMLLATIVSGHFGLPSNARILQANAIQGQNSPGNITSNTTTWIRARKQIIGTNMSIHKLNNYGYIRRSSNRHDNDKRGRNEND